MNLTREQIEQKGEPSKDAQEFANAAEVTFYAACEDYNHDPYCQDVVVEIARLFDSHVEPLRERIRELERIKHEIGAGDDIEQVSAAITELRAESRRSADIRSRLSKADALLVAADEYRQAMYQRHSRLTKKQYREFVQFGGYQEKARALDVAIRAYREEKGER